MPKKPSYLRGLIFTLCFYSTTSLILILLLPTLALPYRHASMCYRLWSKCAILMLHGICGVKLQLKGMERLPKMGNPYIIASAHQSTYETLIFNVLFPQCRFIIKKELQQLPFFGWYMRKSQFIAIDRKAKGKVIKSLMTQAKNILHQQAPIVIFPHGTRIPADNPRPIKHSGLQALLTLSKEAEFKEIPIFPVRMNTGYIWPRRGLKFYPGIITIEIMPAIDKHLDGKELIKAIETTINDVPALLPAKQAFHSDDW